MQSNAIKYFSKSFKIQITCRAGATELEVSLKDDEKGISGEDFRSIYRYYRLQSHDMQQMSGFG